MLTHPAWASIAGLRHGFLDAADSRVAPEWHQATGAPVFLPKQVHGAAVTAAQAEGMQSLAVPPPADAVVTQPGAPLAGILTADCVPVLLLDPDTRAAAAVHAGWRGAAAGVLEATIGYLSEHQRVTPGRLTAVVGPAIGPCCYQVGTEVRSGFEQRSGDVAATAWEQRRDGLYLDLRHAVRCLLVAAGVLNVALLGGCTRCNPTWHSYRRDGAGAGRQLSFIGWAP